MTPLEQALKDTPLPKVDWKAAAKILEKSPYWHLVLECGRKKTDPLEGRRLCLD
jgi:hypothetical protein